MAFLCGTLLFRFSVGVGAFVIGLSQISFFFSYINIPICLYNLTNTTRHMLRLSIEH